MNKETLLAHIDSRLECLNHHIHGAIPDNSWLAVRGKPVDLAAYGMVEEPQAFNFAVWRRAPNPAFGGRTPQQVIDDGTDSERTDLAHVVSAIAALLDGAFS